MLIVVSVDVPPQALTVEPQRYQGVVRFELPEGSLLSDHPARVLWRLVGTLDVSKLLWKARAVEGHVGRLTFSPPPLFTP